MTTPTTALSIPAPSAHMREAKGFGIATENLDLTRYTPAQQEILNFWWHVAKDKGWSLREFDRQTGVSTTTLTRVYRGIYEADVASVVARLTKARETFSHAVENPEFISTSLAKIMFTAFDKTRALRNVTIMWGVKGIGKTTVMLEYTRANNHGHTFYVRCMGSGCTIGQFIRHVADSMHISGTARTTYELRRSIIAYLSKGSRLLIIDELHEIFLTCANRTIIQVCEFLRELADVSDCGLALVGTDKLYNQFFQGSHKEVLGQLVDRGTVQIQLKPKPTKADIISFLRHYGLEFPEGDALQLLNDIIASNGLRKLTQHLRDGQAYANKRGEQTAWQHVMDAHADLQSLSR